MNYHQQMLELLHTLEEEKNVPTILLHTCCAPCSTTVLSFLANYFHVTVFYYNPNIEPFAEYLKRKEEQKRLIKEFPSKYPISFLDCDYEEEKFQRIAKGLETALEGGERCYKCYQLRLEKTAQVARDHHFDYFGTSLTVSPYKNATWLNEIGQELSKKYAIPFLVSDFKKENGYKKSIEYSAKYQLYRQDYCGCIYSKKQRDQKKKAKEVEFFSKQRMDY